MMWTTLDYTSSTEGAASTELWNLATAPATCGHAMDVPLQAAVSPPVTVDNTSTPGANRSTQRPKLVKEAVVSVTSEAPKFINMKTTN